jgi:TolB-like protein/tetratricopeptide (TPR) repeat protein
VTESSHAVFLSYASQDADAAQKICEALRAAGIEVWFDQSELRGGDAWDQSIRKQIKTCALFLPIISRNTHDRVEGYFRLEWKLAVDRSHLISADQAFLLPVVIDDTHDDERVPERFREVQWSRLPSGVTSAAFVERIRRLLSEEPTSTTSGAARGPAVPTKPVLASWRPALIATIVAVVVAAGYLLVNRHVPSKRGAEIGSAPTPAARDAPANVFSPPPHSIAVLPFVNMSGDPKQEYFSDGVTEELLNSLSRLNELQVVARTSSFSFKGQNLDVATIAHKLNVGTVLEGSVRRAGNTVRITVQLINGVSGFHVWSQTYDRSLTDILKVQTDVASSVAQQLEVKLMGNESGLIELGGTKNPHAYDAYLRGMQLFSTWDTGEGVLRAALAAFDQAIGLDAHYADAYVGRARTLDAISIFVAKPTELTDLRGRARDAAEMAVALAPQLGEAHMAVAVTRAYALLDFAGAASEFDHAVALAPGSAYVQSRFAGFSSLIGHHDVAIKAVRRAVGLDPQNFHMRLELAEVLRDAHRYGEALMSLHDATVLQPRSHRIEGEKSAVLLASGQTEQARQECEEPATPLDEDDRYWCLTLAYHALGREADAAHQLEQLTALLGDRAAYLYAGVYAQWGDIPSALQWLSKAERLRSPGFQGLRVDWQLDPIRNEPQFKAIQSRMNFPP